MRVLQHNVEWDLLDSERRTLLHRELLIIWVFHPQRQRLQ